MAIEVGLAALERFAATSRETDLNALCLAFVQEDGLSTSEHERRSRLVESFRIGVAHLATPRSQNYEGPNPLWELLNALGRNEPRSAFVALQRLMALDSSWLHGSGGLEEAGRRIGQLLLDHTDDSNLRREISEFIPQISNQSEIGEVRREVFSARMGAMVGTTLVTGGIAGAVGGAIEGGLLRWAGYQTLQRMTARQLMQSGARELAARVVTRLAGTVANAFTFNAINGTATAEHTRQTSEDLVLMHLGNWLLQPALQRLAPGLRAPLGLITGGLVLTGSSSLRAMAEHRLGWSQENASDHWNLRSLIQNTALHAGLSAGHAMLKPVISSIRETRNIPSESPSHSDATVRLTSPSRLGLTLQAAGLGSAMFLGAETAEGAVSNHLHSSGSTRSPSSTLLGILGAGLLGMATRPKRGWRNSSPQELPGEAFYRDHQANIQMYPEGSREARDAWLKFARELEARGDRRGELIRIEEFELGEAAQLKDVMVPADPLLEVFLGIFASLAQSGGSRQALEARRNELNQQLEADFRNRIELSAYKATFTWRRGFIESVGFREIKEREAWTVLSSEEARFLQEVRFIAIAGKEFEKIFKLEVWNRYESLPTLTIRSFPASRAAIINSLTTLPVFRNLTNLSLSYNNIRDAEARAIAESSNLRSLSRLDLEGVGIGEAGRQALDTSPNLRNCKIIF